VVRGAVMRQRVYSNFKRLPSLQPLYCAMTGFQERYACEDHLLYCSRS